MTTHLGVMILFAAAVSLVFGTIFRDEPAEELRLAGRIFAGMVVGAYGVGWLMYLAFG